MERIIIIGCGGAGKSTLARQLGEITGLPVVHLDQIWWSPGNWQHITREEFDRILALELAKPKWIMDGDFDRTMEIRLKECDTAIYLDFNRFICIVSWLKRVVTYWGKSRPDMASGCKEWLDPEYVKWQWSYNRKYRKRNYAVLGKAKHVKVIVLKNRRQVRKFLKSLE